VRDRVWLAGEAAAWDTYRRRGYRLVARNWTSRVGELDLVVAKAGTLVFVEVKARASPRFGGPYEAVGSTKQRKLRLLAETFVAAENPDAARFRFDVASVTIRGRGPPDVHLFEDAF
jgi:putative endonuclease